MKRSTPRDGLARRAIAAVRDGVADRWAQLSVLALASPWRMVMLLGIYVLGLFLATAGILAIGLVVGTVADGGSPADLIRGIAVLTGALILSPVLDAVSASLTVGLDRRVRVRRDDQIAGALLAPTRSATSRTRPSRWRPRTSSTPPAPGRSSGRPMPPSTSSPSASPPSHRS